MSRAQTRPQGEQGRSPTALAQQWGFTPTAPVLTRAERETRAMRSFALAILAARRGDDRMYAAAMADARKWLETSGGVR